MRLKARLLGAIDLPSQALALACRMAPEMQISDFDKASQIYQAYHMSRRIYSSKGQTVRRPCLTRHFNRPILECNEPITQWLLIINLLSSPLESLGPSKVPDVVTKR